MSKKITLVMIIALMATVPAMAVYPLTVIGGGSGLLTHTFNSSVYTDVAQVLSAEFTLNTVYTANTITRDFEILKTYNYSQSGMYGNTPNPGVLDWGTFVSTETATGTWVYNDLSYETVYPGPYQPGADTVTASSFVDFNAGTANISNYVAHAGERGMTHQVGSPILSSGYNNTAYSYTPGSNAVNKMETTATFGVSTYITGHGAYSPANLNTSFVNSEGLTMVSPINAGDSFYNGLNIDFSGNAYVFNFTGVKGGGWVFDIAD